MDAVLEVVAKILEVVANSASSSTSFFFTYQPKTPDCMNNKSEEK